MTDLPWIKAARDMLGTHEGVGPRDNPAVLQLFVDATHPEIKHDEVPWCAAAIGAWLHRGGVKGTGSLLALSYATWGQDVKKPTYGCVCVKKRKGGGHVFFCVGYDPKARIVYGLGGNQNDQVSISRFKLSEIIAFRYPANIQVPKLALPTTLAGAESNVKEA